MILAPWNGQGRCPISPEGSGPGRSWFLPRDKVRTHFRGHSSGFASEQPPVRCCSPVFLHPRALPRAAAAALILFPKPNVQPQPPSTPEDASGRGVCGGAGTERRNQPSRSPRAAVKTWFCSRDWAGRRGFWGPGSSGSLVQTGWESGLSAPPRVGRKGGGVQKPLSESSGRGPEVAGPLAPSAAALQRVDTARLGQSGPSGGAGQWKPGWSSLELVALLKQCVARAMALGGPPAGSHGVPLVCWCGRWKGVGTGSWE